MFYADDESAPYWVHHQPLLSLLGAQARDPRFQPIKYRRADAVAKLTEIAARPGANAKSRISVLPANADEEQTLTITHVLWAMFGALPRGQEQRPHRRQSVALDLILDAGSGCYTLLAHASTTAARSSTPFGCTGKPAGRPESRCALRDFAEQKAPATFAATPYDGLHAVYLADALGTRTRRLATF